MCGTHDDCVQMCKCVCMYVCEALVSVVCVCLCVASLKFGQYSLFPRSLSHSVGRSSVGLNHSLILSLSTLFVSYCLSDARR